VAVSVEYGAVKHHHSYIRMVAPFKDFPNIAFGYRSKAYFQIHHQD
jgi:hypothetical protein